MDEQSEDELGAYPPPLPEAASTARNSLASVRADPTFFRR
jgi:hypothetical protein